MKQLIPIVTLLVGVAFQTPAADWPSVKTYEGEYLRRLKMPLGGIGTGTISLSGRGALVDWEIENGPDKGRNPACVGSPHFAIRTMDEQGRKMARILEGPIDTCDYEGGFGCAAYNHGFPRFKSARFKAAYPLATLELADPAMPVEPTLQAFNPLVRGDSDASGIPAILLRWRVKNPTAGRLAVSIIGTIGWDTNIVLSVAGDGWSVTRADSFANARWGVTATDYWRTFVNCGFVTNTVNAALQVLRSNSLAVSFDLAPGEIREVPFVLAWYKPGRLGWRKRWNGTGARPLVGNWYETRYSSAKAVADDFIRRLPDLEAKTLAFVESVLAMKAPIVVKEAALANLSTLRTETCFRTRDGNFFGWEGCADHIGSCYGSCAHVWGYEHALIDLWPDLAKRMTEVYFGPALDPQTGSIVNRVGLPLESARPAPGEETDGGGSLAAADGQMQCVIKAYENWKKTGDDAWIRRLWPRIRKAIEFCWVKGGWDGDVDGVMEGCQHNTMDVEYFGPNPQMEFLYLAALEAEARMAEFCGAPDFARTCRALRERGQAWTEKNLFNGAYYEHKIVPPGSVDQIAPFIRDPGMGTRNLKDPDLQLGAGCLIDQLLGDYAARIAGLGPIADFAHAKTTVATIVDKCRGKPADGSFNAMRDFTVGDEVSLRMAWYPPDRMPRAPFPYFQETMTGFEYVVAALQALYGDKAGAERTVRDIRNRYDGRKRSPFDEAECGHHYTRALASWSVLKAFDATWKKPEETRFIQDPLKGQNVHASTFVCLPNGDYVAAWFQGTKEKSPDVAIWGARRVFGAWEAPRVLAKINVDAPHWNPVLRLADDGRLCLYFKVGRNCSDWRTYISESTDEGLTWSAARELIAGECRGGRGPVRNKCLRLPSGRWLAPASREIGKWRAFIDWSDDDGRSWHASAEIGMPTNVPNAEVIQPTLWTDKRNVVHAYMRSKSGKIWESQSRDDGETWEDAVPTPLPNNNSGIDIVKSADGTLYLALNPTSGIRASRAILEIWRSRDEGKTWDVLTTLEKEKKGEFSYPCIREVRAGLLAVSYTWNRTCIAFRELATE